MAIMGAPSGGMMDGGRSRERTMARTRSLDDLLRTAVTRRGFVAGGLAMAGMPYARLLAQSSGAAPAPLKLGTTPFTLGIASGDPSPDGVVLWTRLAPEPLNGGGMPPVPVSVSWQVADRRADGEHRRERHGDWRRRNGRTPCTSR